MAVYFILQWLYSSENGFFVRLRNSFVNHTEVVYGQKEKCIGGRKVSLEQNMYSLRGIYHYLIYLTETIAGMINVLYHRYRVLLTGKQSEL